MKSYLQRLFIKFLTQHLFNAIGEEDVLRVVGREVRFKGKTLSPEMVGKLKQDAKLFSDSSLWEILMNECKYQANVRMYEKSVSVADIVAGKMMLVNVEVIEKKIASLKS